MLNQPVILLLLLSNLAVPLVTMWYAERWKAKEQTRLKAVRDKHVAELQMEKDRLTIATHEALLDSDALVLACQEIQMYFEDEDGDQIYSHWHDVRDAMLMQAKKHSVQFSQREEERLRNKFNVPIYETRD